jgi:hypothetical protein
MALHVYYPAAAFSANACLMAIERSDLDGYKIEGTLLWNIFIVTS